VIPNLKTLPIASGQEANVSNSSQTHEKSRVAKDGKAFGDVLNSQEAHAKPPQKARAEAAQTNEGGNKQHSSGKTNGNGSGKELPVDSENESTSSSPPKDSTSTGSTSLAKDDALETSTTSLKAVSENSTGKESTGEDGQLFFTQDFTDTNQVNVSKGEVGSSQNGEDKQPNNIPGTVASFLASERAEREAAEVAIKEAADAVLNRGAATSTVSNDINKVAGTVQSVGQLLSDNVKRSESNLSAQKIVTPESIDDGMSLPKSAAQPELLSSLTSPVVINTQSGNSNGVTNQVVLGAAKNDMNVLHSGSLTPDDFAAIQQALGGGVAKEADAAESLEKLRNLETLSTKPITTSQAATSAQTPLVSAVANSPISQVSEVGVDSVLKGGTLTSSVGDPGWDSEFLGRINMLVKGGIQEAKIQLSPPEMGRLEIKVSMEGDSTKIMFAVDNVAARDAIEQAMPRLREMLEQGGLQLSHSEVADHSQSQKDKEQVDEDILNAAASSESDEEGEDAGTWQLGISPSNSTVDYYI